jgi:hypothetical protein
MIPERPQCDTRFRLICLLIRFLFFLIALPFRLAYRWISHDRRYLFVYLFLLLTFPSAYSIDIHGHVGDRALIPPILATRFHVGTRLANLSYVEDTPMKLINRHPIALQTGADRRTPERVYFPRSKTQFAREYVIPAFPNTVPQQTCSALFAQATARWSAISQALRDAWDKYATEHPATTAWGTFEHSGQQLFIRANFYSLSFSHSYQDTPPSYTLQRAHFSLGDVTYFQQAPALQFTPSFSHVPNPDQIYLARLSTSFPTPARKARTNEYRLIYSCTPSSYNLIPESERPCYFPCSLNFPTPPTNLWLQLDQLTLEFSPVYSSRAPIAPTLINRIWQYDSTNYIVYVPYTHRLQFYVNAVLAAYIRYGTDLYLKGDLITLDSEIAGTSASPFSYDLSEFRVNIACPAPTQGTYTNVAYLTQDGDLHIAGDYLNDPPDKIPSAPNRICIDRNPYMLYLNPEQLTPFSWFRLAGPAGDTFWIPNVHTYSF